MSIKPRKKIIVPQLILLIALIASMVFGGYFFVQYRNLKETSSKTPDQRNEELIAVINKVYELPKDETPVVAVVSDEAKFKEEYPVFTTAKKDDSLLLYEKAGQAILFRESENRVIGTATFAIKSGSALQIIATTELQSSTELSLQPLSDKIRVVGKSTPAGQYTTTTVIDVSGKNTEIAQSVATALGATVSNAIPVGEQIDEATEIVVIVANVATPTPPVTP